MCSACNRQGVQSLIAPLSMQFAARSLPLVNLSVQVVSCFSCFWKGLSHCLSLSLPLLMSLCFCCSLFTLDFLRQVRLPATSMNLTTPWKCTTGLGPSWPGYSQVRADLGWESGGTHRFHWKNSMLVDLGGAETQLKRSCSSCPWTFFL